MVPRRWTPWRVAGAVLIIAVAAYLAAVAYLVSRETAIVFHADVAAGTLRPAAPFEAVTFRRKDGVQQPMWLMRTTADPSAHPWVLFLHGSGAPISTRLNILHYERLRALGLNVAAPEYRGYSGTPGVPTQAGVESDARSAYGYLQAQLGVSAAKLVVYGWSLGSAVAVDLASREPEAAVVLEGAPSSLVDIGELRYPYIPIRLLMRNPFDAIREVARIHAPMLFLHSREDAVVPIAEGRRLFDAATAPKSFVEVTGGHLYAAERDPAFFPAVRAFLATRGILR